MSMIARHGSGSACRSFFGGFVEWKKGKGKDHESSYAEQLHGRDFWPELKMVVVVLDAHEKRIKSTAGMKICKESSPYYDSWIKASETDLQDIKQAFTQKDFTKVGSIMEKNCLRMHSVMISASPPLIYWKPETLILLDKIQTLRENNLECYYTIDAGANIMILCLEKDVEKILESMDGMNFIHDFIVCNAGDDAKISEEHLF